MKAFQYTCKATLGLHARSCRHLATECTGLKSAVTIESNGMSASGTDVLAIIALRAKKGDVLNIKIEALPKRRSTIMQDCKRSSPISSPRTTT